MNYVIKVEHQDTGNLHSEIFENITDLFKASDNLTKMLTDNKTTIYGGTYKQLLFQHDPADLFKHAFTKNFKDLDSQEIYKLKSHWLEIAYNIHNNNTKSFLSNFKYEYKLPGDLCDIKFSDGVYLGVNEQNVEEGANLDFSFIINNEGLKVLCTDEKTGKVKILNYKLEEIEYYTFYNFKYGCEFMYRK